MSFVKGGSYVVRSQVVRMLASVIMMVRGEP
jgi:hypothetical protein